MLQLNRLPANMSINFIRRLLAGFANCLLTGNVYMAECAPCHLVPSLKQIEVMSCDVFPFIVFLFFAVTLSLASRHRRPAGALVPFSSLPSMFFSNVSVSFTLSLLAASYLLSPSLAP